jgi:hypothetical protein
MHGQPSRRSHPFFDIQQINNALRNEAIPALERLAENPRLLDGARFERDDLPSYRSSTQSWEPGEEGLWAATAPQNYDDGTVSRFRALVAQPLTKKEQETVANRMAMSSKIYTPGARYQAEARAERARLLEFFFSGRADSGARKFLGGPVGELRMEVVVRRNIKRRWQKLGVWNAAWGIADREPARPGDETWKWKWAWQNGSHAAEWSFFPDERQPGPHVAWAPIAEANARHPTLRAVRLRDGLGRAGRVVRHVAALVPVARGARRGAHQGRADARARYVPALGLAEARPDRALAAKGRRGRRVDRQRRPPPPRARLEVALREPVAGARGRGRAAERPRRYGL